MLSVFALKEIPEKACGITLKGQRERDGHGPSDGDADEDIVDDVDGTDCEDPSVEEKNREFGHPKPNGTKYVKRGFCLFINQELMCMTQLAIDQFLMRSQAPNCGCYDHNRKSTSGSTSGRD